MIPVRVLLRVLAPLLGLTLAVAGVLVVIEVVVAWVRPPAVTGVIVPWPDWRVALENRTWDRPPVSVIAIAVAVVGLVLVLVGLLARRSDLLLEGVGDDMTVATTPRVLARLVGTRVREADDVAAASVTASARRVRVAVEAWDAEHEGLDEAVAGRIEELLDELPLTRRPRVAVSVAERKGPR